MSHLIRSYIYTRITKPMKMKYRLPACWCCAFIDLYLIGQGRVLCDNDPIVSMLTFLISSNSMSISLIADDMSWIFNLTDMAVTSDNKLLLCNCESSHPKVYIYKDYKSYEDEISFTSVVLINCMQYSRGRVITALSVHGTTVIPQGSLVNDISSS
jgi:hypothetical protein